jgi:hypothetical protein
MTDSRIKVRLGIDTTAAKLARTISHRGIAQDYQRRRYVQDHLLEVTRLLITLVFRESSST